MPHMPGKAIEEASVLLYVSAACGFSHTMLLSMQGLSIMCHGGKFEVTFDTVLKLWLRFQCEMGDTRQRIPVLSYFPVLISEVHDLVYLSGKEVWR